MTCHPWWIHHRKVLLCSPPLSPPRNKGGNERVSSVLLVDGVLTGRGSQSEGDSPVVVVVVVVVVIVVVVVRVPPKPAPEKKLSDGAADSGHTTGRSSSSTKRHPARRRRRTPEPSGSIPFFAPTARRLRGLLVRSSISRYHAAPSVCLCSWWGRRGWGRSSCPGTRGATLPLIQAGALFRWHSARARERQITSIQWEPSVSQALFFIY